MFRARLRAPFGSAWGAIGERDLVLLALTDGAGVSGWGEAAPLAGYDGIGLDDVRGALEDCRAVLADGDDAPLPELLAACARVAVLPPAIAAVDLALWDLAGKRAGAPVWRLLGAGEPTPLAVNATIAAPDRAGVAAAAGDAVAAGFDTVKVKVGAGDDAARLAVVRATCGPDVAIRLDANGAWSVHEAIAVLAALAPVGIELCEEPVHGLDALAAVTAATTIPIAIDESVREPGALERRAADAVCLKIAAAGGISGVIDAARRARATGYEVYLASTLDGPLGIAAALHAAAVVAPDRPCGLATLGLFATPPSTPVPVSGRIAVPSGPGLGDGLREWYR